MTNQPIPSLLLAATLALAAIFPAAAAPPNVFPVHVDSVRPLPDGSVRLEWKSVPGRTYFLQSSLDLETWSFLEEIIPPSATPGTIEFNASATIDGANTPAPHLFWRVVSTDHAIDQNANDDDFDGDGISNIDEIDKTHTNPFVWDSDGDGKSDWFADSDADGLADGWELAFATRLLALFPDPAHWPPEQWQALLSGNLDAGADYTGDGLTAARQFAISPAPDNNPGDNPGNTAAPVPRFVCSTRTASSTGYLDIDPDGEAVSSNARILWSDDVSGAASEMTGNQIPDLPQLNLSDWIADRFAGNWNWENLAVSAPASLQSLSDLGETGFGEAGLEHSTFVAEGTGETINRYDFVKKETLVKIHLGRIAAHPVKITLLKITDKEPLPGSGGEASKTAETIEMTVPAGRTTSDWEELAPGLEEGMNIQVRLVPLGAAFDYNRDGEIRFDDASDRIPPGEYFDFWLNDDCDKGHTVDKDDWEEDDVLLGSPEDDEHKEQRDYAEPGLRWRRDLEDIERVHLDCRALFNEFPPDDPALSLRLRIRAEEGDPAVTLFQPVEPDGGVQYIKDENTGYNQLQGNFGTNLCSAASSLNQATEIPRSAWENALQNSGGIVPLLFEAFVAQSLESKGELVFELHRNGVKIAEFPPLPIRLRRCRNLYETWTVGDVAAPGIHWEINPAATPQQITGAGLPAPETAEERDCIVLVLGWNLAVWEKTAFADAMFKRLRRHGYKGRFVTFRWPTFWGVPKYVSADHPAHFDGSEMRAWKSAPGLVALIENLKTRGFKVRLYAHSQGNVAASEALRLMAAAAPDRVTGVHTYLACQAALSSHVFDNTTPEMQHGGLLPPNVYGYYWQNGAPVSPDTWQAENRPSYMAPQYMPTDTRFVNHYNPDDYALGGSLFDWQHNQRHKPDADYLYENHPYPWNPGRFKHLTGLSTFQLLDFPAKRHEIFSFAAESWSFALGQRGDTAGVFAPNVPVDLDADFDFGDAHKGHSAQFRSTIQKRWTYWTQALDDMSIKPIIE